MNDIKAGNFGEFCAALRIFRKLAQKEVRSAYKGVYRFWISPNLFSVYHPNWLEMGVRTDSEQVTITLRGKND